MRGLAPDRRPRKVAPARREITFRHALSLSVYSDPHSSELRHRKHTPMAVDLAS